MLATTKNVNPTNAQRKLYPIIGNKALAINLNPERHTPIPSTPPPDEITLESRNPQAFGATSTNPAPTTRKIASGSSHKTLNKQHRKSSTVQPTMPTHGKPIFGSIPMISVANRIEDPAAEHRPKEVQTTPSAREMIFMKVTPYNVPNQQFPEPWEQHIHYNAVPAPYVTMPTDSSCASSQSSELQLALPALPPSTTVSTTTPDMSAINQSTSAANMVIPSKEIASTAPIVSPGIVCWNAIGHAFQDPCHIRSSVCQIDNLTPSSKTFVCKYASMRAFQIPIKLRAVKAHALIDTANDNVLEEIPEEDQTEEIEAEQPTRQAQLSPHQPPPRQLEVTELAESIFLVAQVSTSISPHRQQWVNSTVFPTTTATIPDVIVQPLATNNIAAELPIETAIVNVTNGHCLLLFIKNTLNSIKLHLNQLIAMAKHMLGHAKLSVDCQVATATADHDLTDHKPAALDKSFPCHTTQQKLEFALNKMTKKTYISTAQKSKALCMLQQNHYVFSLHGDKPTITKRRPGQNADPKY
uniref:Uncharacterized protein n=1 Tax=Romanomermis culicivorax TaxID=13658 RepID=A0A915K0Z2_ROMCU